MTTILISTPNLSAARSVIGRAATRLRALSAGRRRGRQQAEFRDGDSARGALRDLPDHILRDIGFVRGTPVRMDAAFPYL